MHNERNKKKENECHRYDGEAYKMNLHTWASASDTRPMYQAINLVEESFISETSSFLLHHFENEAEICLHQQQQQYIRKQCTQWPPSQPVRVAAIFFPFNMMPPFNYDAEVESSTSYYCFTTCHIIRADRIIRLNITHFCFAQ